MTKLSEKVRKLIKAAVRVLGVGLVSLAFQACDGVPLTLIYQQGGAYGMPPNEAEEGDPEGQNPGQEPGEGSEPDESEG